jgi:tetratricopeptide (TPR) repeat protein
MLYSCQQKMAKKTVALDYLTNGPSQQKLQNFMFRGIEINNAAYVALSKGDAKKAIELYKEAVQIKVDTFGPDHYNLCISLGGLADAYLSLKDYTNARIEAERMKRIAQLNDSAEQLRISNAIIRDINKVIFELSCNIS